MDPETLMAGPRGRRLCLNYLDASARNDAEFRIVLSYAQCNADPDVGSMVAYRRRWWHRLFARPDEFDPGVVGQSGPAEVAAASMGVDLLPVTAEVVTTCLADSVAQARYWQSMDGADVLGADPVLQPVLRRVAEHIAASPVVDWWAEPFSRPQWFVEWAEDDDVVEPLAADERLRRWRSEMLESERGLGCRGPRNVRVPFSGQWWSTPPFGLPVTTPMIPGEGLGPSGRWFIEDDRGWQQGSWWQAHIPAGARIFEIDGADSWVRLCDSYGIEATASKRHDWYRVTGVDGRWVIPDWRAVARDFDGIHVTVAGYVATATQFVAVGDAGSVLAGWAPGECRWLVDVE